MKTYHTRSIHGRRWVWYSDNPVGAITYNGVRAYVFPFYTPKGALVIQECAGDHVHHQGLMVGQDAVNGENFWAMLHPNYPRNKQLLLQESTGIQDDGIVFDLYLDWVTEDGRPVIREQRIVRFSAHRLDDEMICHEAYVNSTLTAAHGPVEFGQTKEGGIGMRVNPLLETELGGVIRDSEGREGEAQVFDQCAAWIDVSGHIQGREAGVLMMPAPDTPRIPWFVRDYGIHLHSPRRHAPLLLRQGESVSGAVHFLAHDGLDEWSHLSKRERRNLLIQHVVANEDGKQ
jgi:hypothetical protein